jgi:hypothetical protein
VPHVELDSKEPEEAQEQGLQAEWEEWQRKLRRVLWRLKGERTEHRDVTEHHGVTEHLGDACSCRCLGKGHCGVCPSPSGCSTHAKVYADPNLNLHRSTRTPGTGKTEEMTPECRERLYVLQDVDSLARGIEHTKAALNSEITRLHSLPPRCDVPQKCEKLRSQMSLCDLKLDILLEIQQQVLNGIGYHE